MLDSMKVRGRVAGKSRTKVDDGGYLVIAKCSHTEEGFALSGNRLLSLVLDGALFDDGFSGDFETEVGALDGLFRFPGAFAFLGKTKQGLAAGRDPLGQKPLYWGRDENGDYAFASLKFALERVGVRDPRAVGPGEVVNVTSQGESVSTNHLLYKPSPRETSEKQALEELEKLLFEAVRKMVPKKAAIAFSGGLDSALVAVACKKAGLDPELVTVGLHGQPELEHASLVARSIELHHTLRPLTAEEIVEALPRVIHSIESDNPVTVGISVPFYFVCEQAREIGERYIVAGQLSDELFGGYARFESIAREKGLAEADLALWKSVLAASAGDFEPGDKLAVASRLELRCPFAYLPLVKYSLQIPTELKIEISTVRAVRKYILRRLAEKWELPASVVNRPKSAFQYSSGVQKVLKKEARRNKMEVGHFLKSLHSS